MNRDASNNAKQLKEDGGTLLEQGVELGDRVFCMPKLSGSDAADAAAAANHVDAPLPEAIEAAAEGRLGAMRLDGERYVYPLMAVWAERFVAPRLALIGDAAVGMHPVTAHGHTDQRLSGTGRNCYS